LLYEKAVFSIGSRDRRLSVWPSGSMPGQKSIRLAKKGGGPSFPMRLFVARKKGERGKDNEKSGVIDQLNWR